MFYRMLKKHVRERRYNLQQWCADRGRAANEEAWRALPWAAVLDDEQDDVESLADDVLGRRERRASEAMFARMHEEENESRARFLESQAPLQKKARTAHQQQSQSPSPLLLLKLRLFDDAENEGN
jgi:hypothetical protein